MSWLIFGGYGQLGLTLGKVLADLGMVHTLVGSREADIRNAETVRECVALKRPSVIVNCAAWTNVDGAEDNANDAFAINAFGAENVARAARRLGASLIQISTDFVFDGQKTSPYQVDDIASPISVYGRSKLEGERLSQDAHPDGTWVVRTAWLYSEFGHNFARSIARRALSKEPLSVVDDCVGQPTNAHDLATQMIRLVESDIPPGTLHGTNAGQVTWFEFASAIVEDLPDVNLSRISSHSLQQRASRPKYSALDNSKWSLFGVEQMTDWRTSLMKSRKVIFDSVRSRHL